MQNNSGIHPTGWRVLVKPQVVDQMTDGGIALPDEVVEKNEVMAQVGQVVEVGPTAFSDDKLFPGRRPQYGAGSWVLFAPHTGHKVTVQTNGKRITYRLMNDDHVLGIAEDPDTIKSSIL